MHTNQYLFRARDKVLGLGRATRVMGIINVTPDSFSDGGRFLDADRAIARGLELIEEGADILDIGGESSRPGAEPVPADVEMARIGPVLTGLRPRTDAILSVDTYKASVADQALRLGADMVNDISAFRLDQAMPEVVARYRAGVALMHMRGTPGTMQSLPPSPEILAEVRRDLTTALSVAAQAGIGSDHIIVDPGIGFGKTADDNLKLINCLMLLHELGYPVLVGPSRKSFLGKITGAGPGERTAATAVVSAIASLRGAQIVRVHDVKQVREALLVADAIRGETISQC